MELIIRLAAQTGLVIGIMACATGGTIGAIELAKLAERLWGGESLPRRRQ